MREYGSGSVSQRKDGYWVGRYVVGHTSEGKKKYKVVYGKTEQEAKRKLRELIKEVNKADFVNVKKAIVKDYMDNWLTTYKKAELKPKSYDRLEQTLRLDVYPYIGQLQIHAIDTDDVQNMINGMKEAGKSHSSIKKAYDAVNECFKHGIIKKKLQNNPALGVALPSKKQFPQKQIPFYTEDEAKVLVDEALRKYKNGKSVYRVGAFVPLLINTGLRLGELLALQWKRDIDLENKVLTVHTNLAIVRDRSEDAEKKYILIEQNTVKTDAGQDRSISLNEDAVNALLLLKEITGNETFVMTTKNHTVVKPRQLDQMFRRITVAAGFPEDKVYGVHSLRHTFATLLLMHGVDIKTVSKLLGHSDVTVTYNTYIHVIKAYEKKALATIPSLMETKAETAGQEN